MKSSFRKKSGGYKVKPKDVEKKKKEIEVKEMKNNFKKSLEMGQKMYKDNLLLKKEVQRVTKKNNQYITMIKRKKDEVEDLRILNEKLEEKLREEKETKTVDTVDLEKLRKDNEELEKKVMDNERLLKNNVDLRKEVKTLRVTLSEVEKEQSSMSMTKKDLEEIEKKKEQFLTQKMEAEKKLTQLEEKYEKLLNEKEKIAVESDARIIELKQKFRKEMSQSIIKMESEQKDNIEKKMHEKDIKEKMMQWEILAKQKKISQLSTDGMSESVDSELLREKDVVIEKLEITLQKVRNELQDLRNNKKVPATEALKTEEIQIIEKEVVIEDPTVMEGEAPPLYSRLGLIYILLIVLQLPFVAIVFLFFISFFLFNDYIMSSGRVVFGVIIIINCVLATASSMANLVVGSLSGMYSIKEKHQKAFYTSLTSVVLSVLSTLLISIALFIGFNLTLEGIDDERNNPLFVVAHLVFGAITFLVVADIIVGILLVRKEYKLLEEVKGDEKKEDEETK